jgi:hypothetical protein
LPYRTLANKETSSATRLENMSGAIKLLNRKDRHPHGTSTD